MMVQGCLLQVLGATEFPFFIVCEVWGSRLTEAVKCGVWGLELAESLGDGVLAFGIEVSPVATSRPSFVRL